jgi:hypothetical protein
MTLNDSGQTLTNRADRTRAGRGFVAFSIQATASSRPRAASSMHIAWLTSWALALLMTIFLLATTAPMGITEPAAIPRTFGPERTNKTWLTWPARGEQLLETGTRFEPIPNWLHAACTTAHTPSPIESGRVRTMGEQCSPKLMFQASDPPPMRGNPSHQSPGAIPSTGAPSTESSSERPGDTLPESMARSGVSPPELSIREQAVQVADGVWQQAFGRPPRLER